VTRLTGMTDDWRLRIEVHEQSRAHRLLEHVDASELEHELETSFQDRVIVSRENSTIFFYAGEREQAERAREVAQRFADEHGWELGLELSHWHPTADAWEDPDKPLPADDAGRAAEHAELIADERRQALEEGQPEFEVRIECASRADAVALSRKLRDEGLPNVHRFKYVIVGAPDEDTADALARRIRAEAPEGSVVTAEGTLGAVLTEGGAANPFAVFGGLGG
jgi:hypothetical protein